MSNIQRMLTLKAKREQDQEIKDSPDGEITAEDQENVKIVQSFNIKKFLMELVGSFAIVYFGNWAQIFCDLRLTNHIAVSITIGFTMCVLTWIGSDISGAHFNPITTVLHILIKIAFNGLSEDNSLEYCCALLGISISWGIYCWSSHISPSPRINVQRIEENEWTRSPKARSEIPSSINLC